MAGKLLQIGNNYNADIRQYCVDTVEEIQLLPTTTSPGTGDFANNAEFKCVIPMGSTCIVGNGDEDVLVFMLFSDGWKEM